MKSSGPAHHTLHMLVVINNACGFADPLHSPSTTLFPPGDRGCGGIVLGGNSLDHPLVVPGQNKKNLAVVTDDDVTSPHSTCINKTLPLPHCKCMKIPFQLSLPGSRIS